MSSSSDIRTRSTEDPQPQPQRHHHLQQHVQQRQHEQRQQQQQTHHSPHHHVSHRGSSVHQQTQITKLQQQFSANTVFDSENGGLFASPVKPVIDSELVSSVSNVSSN
jgi:hypothetical protein